MTNTYCQKCGCRRVVGEAGICNECLAAAGLPKRPHGLKGRRANPKTTPADNEAAKEQMLKVSYEDIKREFSESVAESHEPKRKAVVQ